MILKSFGCSFIFGTDLHDDGFGNGYATASDYTWPALLAKKLNLTYDCFAQPGSGNLQILERLLNELTNSEPTFYVVGWSWIDRFDYYDSDSIRWSKWKTIMPVDQDTVSHTYYRHLHNQYKDKLTTLIYIKTAISALKQKGCQFIMTAMDDLIYEDQWHTSPAVLELQQSIVPHIRKFENKTFLDWSKDQGFEISPTMHPLEAAHNAAAEYAANHFLV